MGDDETRSALAQFAHRLLHQQLGAGVHRAGGLVEDQQLGLRQERPRDCDQLLSPALMLPPSSLTRVS